MKRYFLTGLVILLPLALTIACLVYIFNLLTEPFVGPFSSLIDFFNINLGIGSLSHDQVERGFAKIIIIIIMFFFTVFLGFLAEWFFVHFVLGFWENQIKKIPLIGSVYKTFKDVIGTLFSSDKKSFSKVVLVKFPSDSYSLGLVTKEQLHFEESQFVSVFIPMGPNPTAGFVLFYKPEEVIPLDMKVDEAFKYIVSCGVVDVSLKRVNA